MAFNLCHFPVYQQFTPHWFWLMIDLILNAYVVAFYFQMQAKAKSQKKAEAKAKAHHWKK